MNFTELQAVLQNLIKRKIYFTEIAQALNVTAANISKRAKADSEITVSELQAIESFYGKNIYKSRLNSLKRCFDEDIEFKSINIGQRINKIQKENNLTNTQMAGLLNIPEEEFKNIINGKSFPNINIIYYLKQNFKITSDWLLFGD